MDPGSTKQILQHEIIQHKTQIIVTKTLLLGMLFFLDRAFDFFVENFMADPII